VEDDADPFRAPTGTPPPGTGQQPPPPPTTAPAHGSLTFERDLGADRPGYQLTAADKLLDQVFGDHVHSNDGTHLSGGVIDDQTWQKYWKRLVAFFRHDMSQGPDRRSGSYPCWPPSSKALWNASGTRRDPLFCSSYLSSS
jgi:hypothetical protein